MNCDDSLNTLSSAIRLRSLTAAKLFIATLMTCDATNASEPTSNTKPSPNSEPAVTQSFELPADNPFSSISTLPLHTPAFDKIKEVHFQPAFMEGMKQQIAEMEAIAGQTASPTFDGLGNDVRVTYIWEQSKQVEGGGSGAAIATCAMPKTRRTARTNEAGCILSFGTDNR